MFGGSVCSCWVSGFVSVGGLAVYLFVVLVVSADPAAAFLVAVAPDIFCPSGLVSAVVPASISATVSRDYSSFLVVLLLLLSSLLPHHVVVPSFLDDGLYRQDVFVHVFGFSSYCQLLRLIIVCGLGFVLSREGSNCSSLFPDYVAGVFAGDMSSLVGGVFPFPIYRSEVLASVPCARSWLVGVSLLRHLRPHALVCGF